MFMLRESIRSAIESIWAHGFRSLLASLGIIIGVASVIAVVSVVQGLSYTISEQFSGLGGNSLTIRSYTPFKKQLQGRWSKLRHSDMRAICQRVEGISHIAPVLFTQSGTQDKLSYRSQVTFSRVVGIGPSYPEVNGLYLEEGRFLPPTTMPAAGLSAWLALTSCRSLKCRMMLLVNFSMSASSGARLPEFWRNRGNCWAFRAIASFCCPTTRLSV